MEHHHTLAKGLHQRQRGRTTSHAACRHDEGRPLVAVRFISFSEKRTTVERNETQDRGLAGRGLALPLLPLPLIGPLLHDVDDLRRQ